MKRADIAVGKEYAVRYFRRIVRRRVFCFSVDGRGVLFEETTSGMPLSAVLMPWPEYEAQQKAKAERDAAVRGERTRNEEMVGFELRGKLVAAGVRIQAWDPERRTVTLRWEDAAKLIGGTDGR